MLREPDDPLDIDDGRDHHDGRSRRSSRRYAQQGWIA
jgi:hypothetical protein